MRYKRSSKILTDTQEAVAAQKEKNLIELQQALQQSKMVTSAPNTDDAIYSMSVSELQTLIRCTIQRYREFVLKSYEKITLDCVLDKNVTYRAATSAQDIKTSMREWIQQSQGLAISSGFGHVMEEILTAASKSRKSKVVGIDVTAIVRRCIELGIQLTSAENTKNAGASRSQARDFRAWYQGGKDGAHGTNRNRNMCLSVLGIINSGAKTSTKKACSHLKISGQTLFWVMTRNPNFHMELLPLLREGANEFAQERSKKLDETVCRLSADFEKHGYSVQGNIQWSIWLAASIDNISSTRDEPVETLMAWIGCEGRQAKLRTTNEPVTIVRMADDQIDSIVQKTDGTYLTVRPHELIVPRRSHS